MRNRIEGTSVLSRALFLVALSVQVSWSTIVITMQDSTKAPIAGVSCEDGGASAVSDASGKLTLSDSTAAAIQPRQSLHNSLLSQIPLASGERATVSLTNLRGQNVFQRRIGLGERLTLPRSGQGIYFVTITGRNMSARKCFVNLGKELSFEGVDIKSAYALAKKAADVTVTCSKSGYPTKTYVLTDGSATTIDFTRASAAVSIVYDTAVHPISFAASELQTGLLKSGFSVANVPLAGLASATGSVRIVITTMNTSAAQAFLATPAAVPAPAPKPQGFAIRKDASGSATTWWVLGGDTTGAMYGGLEVAELTGIAHGFSSLQTEDQNPYLHYRGVKFNCPFDKRAFSYDDANDLSQLAIKECWDMNFWHTYFDEMARLRMNQMAIWNKVPWPAMVVTPGFEDVALNDVMMGDGSIYKPAGINNINDKINFWKAVMQYAADRGVEFWMMSWDIYLEGKYGNHTFVKGDAASKAYYYASNVQLVKTYPLLRGIGFADQESMGGTPDSWLAQTYAQGIMDGLAAVDPNQNRLFGSYIRSDIGSTLDQECAKITGFTERTSLGHEDKYSGAFMFTTLTPGGNFIKATANHRYWLTCRDDSYVMFRGGGDPEWLRSYIKDMGDTAHLASINIGGNRTWGMDSASLTFKNPHELVIQKRWWTALLFSRLGYDPTLSSQRYLGILGARFPEVDAATLLNAWVNASDASIMAHSMRSAGADYSEYYEMCLQQGGFLTIADFLNTSTQNENDVTSISNYIANTGKAGAIPAPAAIDSVLTKANRTLQILGTMPGSVSSPELSETLGDITALALLGRYYGCKLQAALASAQGSKASEIANFQAASKAWSAYATWTSLFYLPQNVERASMSALGKSINPTGVDNVKVIQLDVDNELYTAAGLTAASAPTISAIADQSVAAGASTGPIGFTVGAAASLTAAAASTNQALVPDASIVVGGTGASRTVTITPAAGKTGRVVITVTVSDGTLVKNASFVLTVN